MATGDMDSRSEVETLHMKANQVTDSSLESTRRMLQLCEETQEIGVHTINMLDVQGEQLDRIEEDMYQINADMKEAEKNLTGMEKCCGCCLCPCQKSPEFKEDANTWNASEDRKVVHSQPTSRAVIERDRAAGTSGFITKVTNDAREDEMEENMGQVDNIIGNLRNMAIDMGSEIESQNTQIDWINEQATSNEFRVRAANARASKLLKD